MANTSNNRQSRANENRGDDRDERKAINPEGLAEFKRELKTTIESSAFQASLVAALGDPKIAARFAKVALLAINKRPPDDYLWRCTKLSFTAAILEAAELNLEIGSATLAHAYLVPRFDKDWKEWHACFQASWKGKIELARRSGLVLRVDAVDVHQNDPFEFWRIKVDRPVVMHRILPTDRGPVVAYYAVAYFKDGGIQVSDVWDVDRIRKHRDQFSKQPNGSAWRDSEDSMARKTMIHQLEAYIPLSAEQQVVHESDMDVETTFKVEAETMGEESIESPAAPPGGAGNVPAGVEKQPSPAAEPRRKSRALAAAEERAIDLPALDPGKQKDPVPASPLPQPAVAPPSAAGGGVVRTPEAKAVPATGLCIIDESCPAMHHDEACPRSTAGENE